MALKIKNRLLASYLFAIVALAGAFGAFVYFVAAQQLVGRLRGRERLLGAAAGRGRTAAHKRVGRETHRVRVRHLRKSHPGRR